MSDRTDALERLLESRPDDPRLLFGLALEYLKEGRVEDAVDALRRYLGRVDDEGNAWGRLGEALRALGSDDEARRAYREGVAAARRHGHPSMAEAFEAVLEGWD
ncbi:MAG TPA: tetratricopeptide repeat protein [Longimicrobiales bacterium]|jgi:Flp pilus assembly protein TadD|nr:tetratricopeptide repeat protein [Longimicrobiales bacterium]